MASPHGRRSVQPRRNGAAGVRQVVASSGAMIVALGLAATMAIPAASATASATDASAAVPSTTATAASWMPRNRAPTSPTVSSGVRRSSSGVRRSSSASSTVRFTLSRRHRSDQNSVGSTASGRTISSRMSRVKKSVLMNNRSRPTFTLNSTPSASGHAWSLSRLWEATTEVRCTHHLLTMSSANFISTSVGYVKKGALFLHVRASCK
ncbi:hypothetical protein ABIB56_000983 [Glaciihabitans sp. UYNi722]